MRFFNVRNAFKFINEEKRFVVKSTSEEEAVDMTTEVKVFGFKRYSVLDCYHN